MSNGAWLSTGYCAANLYMQFENVSGNGQIACTVGVGACTAVAPPFSTTFAYSVKFTENVARLALSYQW